MVFVGNVGNPSRELSGAGRPMRTALIRLGGLRATETRQQHSKAPHLPADGRGDEIWSVVANLNGVPDMTMQARPR